jgi:hypothetical protein
MKRGRGRRNVEIKKNFRNKKKEGWGRMWRHCERRTKMCERKSFEEAIHISTIRGRNL